MQEGAQKGVEEVTMETSEKPYGCIRMEKVSQKMGIH